MDLYEADSRLRQLQERYLHWREARSELRDCPGNEALPAWLADGCRALDPDAPLDDREALLERLEALGEALKHDLREARLDAWYQQGKMLRYSTVLLENRLDTLAVELEARGADKDERGERVRVLLRTQLEALRENLRQWERRRGARPMRCTPAELEPLIADPQHDADKEALEEVVAQAQAAAGPAGQARIRLSWDLVTGEVYSAEIDAGRAADAA